MKNGKDEKFPLNEQHPHKSSSFKKHGKKIAVTAGALGIGVIGAGTTGLLADAAKLTVTMDDTNILDATGIIKSKLLTTSETKKNPISSDYSFVAKFNNKTKVVPFPASEWKDKTQVQENSDGEETEFKAYTLVSPPNSLEGKVGIDYVNVGKFNGRVVNLHIEILNWDETPWLDSKDQQLISYSKNSIRHWTSGYQSVQQKWTYQYDDTGEQVKDMNGMYFTFEDFDSMQFMKFGQATTEAIENIIVDDNSEVQYEYSDGTLKLGYISDTIDSKTGNVKRNATVLFRGVRSIIFSWSRDYKNAKVSESYEYDSKIGAHMFYYTGKKLAPTELDPPKKFVSHDVDKKEKHEIKKKSNTLTTQDQIITYRITQIVPDESKDFYYNSFGIYDALPEGITPLTDTLEIIDDDGNVVTDSFKDKWTNVKDADASSELSLVATTGSLNSSKFYGQTYDIIFDAKIESSAALEKYRQKETNEISIPNTARSIKNSELKKSNTVTTLLKDLDYTGITKYNVKDGGNSSTKGKVTVSSNGKHQYKMTAHVGNEHEVSTLTLADDLENIWDMKDIHIFDKDGKDITDKGKLNRKEDEESFEWKLYKDTAGNASDYLGEDVTAVVDVELKNEQDYTKYITADGKIEIPNTAKIILNNSSDDKRVEEKSNKVVVNIPTTKPSAEKVNVTSDGVETTDNIRVEAGKSHKYALDFTIPNDKVINKLTLTDDLEDVLNVKNLKVYDSSNKDITAEGTPEIDEENEVATWTAKDATKYYGKDLRMVIEADMKKGVDLSKYLDRKTMEKAVIPNKGLLSITYKKLEDGTTPTALKQDTNTVNIETGVLEPKSEKYIVNESGKDTKDRTPVKLGEEVQYHLAFDVPNTVKVEDLAFVDDLDNAVDLKSVRIYDGDTDITNKGDLKLNEGDESFEWVPYDVKDVIGKKIDVIVKGQVKEGLALSGYVNERNEIIVDNVAQMVINKDTKFPTNKVQIELPTIDNKANKYNMTAAGGRTEDEMTVQPGKEHNYEMAFTLTNYEKVNSMAIEDDLPDVLDLQDVKIFLGTKDVTKEGKLEFNNKTEKFSWVAEDPSKYAGQTLVAKVSTQLKKDATFEGFYNYKTNKITIPNTATMTLNGGDRSKDKIKTNEVTITTPAVEAKTVKYNIADDEIRTAETQKVKQGDEHKYEMHYTIPNIQSVRTFNLADDLENTMDLNAVKVFEGDVDVTREGKLTLNSDKESFTWQPYEPAAWLGKTLRVTVDATVKKGVDYSKYMGEDGIITIPNVAELVLNNGEAPEDTIKSKKVNVELEKVENSAIKYNDNKAGGKVKDTLKVKPGEDHSYIIDFTINNYKPISKLVLQDDLEDVLDLKSIVVTTENGKDVTNKGTITIDDKKEKFAWTAKDAKEFSGKKLSVRVNATLKSNVTFDGLLSDNKVLIPNIASMIIDNEDYVKSNEVNITTPGIVSNATKWNINKKGVKVSDTMQVNDLELHTYQMDFNISNTEKFTGFLLKDDIPDVLDLLDAKIFITDDGEEKDITNEGTLSIKDDGETFTWIPKEPMKYAGKQLNAVLVVQLKHSVDLTDYLNPNGKIMIPNTGEITYYNGADEPRVLKTTTVDITTPGIGNTIEKYNVAKQGEIIDRQSVDSEAARVAWEEVAENYKYKDAKINYDPETHPESEDQKNDDEVDEEATTLPDEEHDKDPDLPDDDSEINSSSKTVAGYKATGDGVYLKVPARESKEETLKSDGTLANAKLGRPTTNIVRLKPEQTHQYQIGFHVRNNEEIETLKISDDLEDVLNFEGVHIMDGDTDITNQGSLSLNNDDESFTWVAKNPSKYAGKDLVAIVDVKLKSNANFENYDYEGLYDIVNVAYLHVNDEKIMSNPVVVNTVPIKTIADKYNIVNSQTTKETVRVEKGKKHMYELDYRIQNAEEMYFLKIEDDLEDVMDLTDVKLYVKGQEVTDKGTLKVDNEEEHFTWTAHEPNDFSGQLITVKVTSKAKKNADLSSYRNSEVPNKAYIHINDDDPIATNKVLVELYKDPVPDESDTIDPDDLTTNKPSEDDPKKDVKPQEWEEDQPTDNPKDNLVDQLVQTGAEHKTGLIATLVGLLGASGIGAYVMKRRKKSQVTNNETNSDDKEEK